MLGRWAIACPFTVLIPIELIELHNVRSGELAVLFLNRSGLMGREWEGRERGGGGVDLVPAAVLTAIAMLGSARTAL